MSNFPKVSVEKSLHVGPLDPSHKILFPPPDQLGLATINGPLIIGGVNDGYVSDNYQKSMLSILPAKDTPLNDSGEFFGPLADAFIISKQGNPGAGSGNRYDGVGIRVNANSHKIEAGELIQFNSDKDITIEGKQKIEMNGPEVILNSVLTLKNCGNVASRIDQADSLPSSDKNLKKNITPIENALNKVLQLTGVEFDFIEGSDLGHLKTHQIGLIAQDVEKIIPEVVGETYRGTLGISYQHLVSLLIEAIKEQQEQIDELKKYRIGGG